MVLGGRSNPGAARWSRLIGGRSRPISSSSSRIRSALRRSRRIRGQSRWIRGPLQWTTSRLRIDFTGGLYVADTEDQGMGLDPAMLFPESETQLSEEDVIEDDDFVVPETPEEEWPTAVEQEIAAIDISPASLIEPMVTDAKLEQPVVEEEHKAAVEEHLCQQPVSCSRLGSIHTDWRRALFHEEKDVSSQLGLQKGEEDNAMESVQKVSANEKASISDAETDDEGIAPLDEHADEVRGHSQVNASDGDLNEMVKGMLCSLIPAYGSVVDKASSWDHIVHHINLRKFTINSCV